MEQQSGYTSILVWTFVSAAAYVYTGYIETRLPPALLCFWIFIFSAVVFALFNISHLASLMQKLKHNAKNVLIINITTVGCWILTIYPLKYIEPSLVNAIILTVLPLSTLAVEKLTKKRDIARVDYVSSLMLMLGIVFIAEIIFNNKSAMHMLTLQVVATSFVMCLCAGGFLAINNVATKNLSIDGFTPFDILTVRFLLIIAVTAVLARHAIPSVVQDHSLSKILLAAVSLIILPQILIQYAIKRIYPISIAIIAPLMPILAFMLEFYNQNLHPTVWSILGVLYVGLVSTIATSIKYKKAKRVLSR